MRLLKIVRKITKKLHNRVYEFSLLRGEKAKMKDPRRIKLYNSVNFTKVKYKNILKNIMVKKLIQGGINYIKVLLEILIKNIFQKFYFHQNWNHF